MDAWILAVGLLCASEKELTVQRIITTEPMSHAQCERHERDPEMRKRYILEKQAGSCKQILLCVQVGWKTE